MKNLNGGSREWNFIFSGLNSSVRYCKQQHEHLLIPIVAYVQHIYSVFQAIGTFHSLVSSAVPYLGFQFFQGLSIDLRHRKISKNQRTK